MNEALLSRLNRALINEFPVEAIVRRPTKTPDGAGGTVRSSYTTLDAQTVRITGSSRVGDSQQRTLPDGRVVVLEKTIVFDLDGDVQVDDLIDIGDETWEVATVGGRYAIDASVFRHGS